MGSKNRLSKQLIPIIQSYITDDTVAYIEPFVGGGNVIDKIDCKIRLGYDADKYVIATLNALRDGWTPPYEVSKEEYVDIKNNKDNYEDCLVGYIGYELSFGAKWFGGYVKRCDKKSHGDIYSYKSCMKQAPYLKGIKFNVMNFKDLLKYGVRDSVIYCDPPYKGTTKYKTDPFNYDEYYDFVRKLSEKNTVLCSEYWMPDDFECIWEKETTTQIDSGRKANSDKNVRIERLYTYKSK